MPPIDRFANSPLSGWWTGHDRPPKRFATGVDVAVGLGMAIGIVATWVSPLWALVALAVVAFGILALKRSEFALLGILSATSSIIFESELPVIFTPVGSLHIPDAILLLSLSLILIRGLSKPGFIRHTPLDWPLLALYGVMLLSTFVAILGSSVEVEMARREIRVVTYYLTFFVVTNLVREDHQLHFLVRGMLLLATVVAAAMVAQFLLGESRHLLPGRVEVLQTQGTEYSGIIRILPPGQSLILVAFISMTATLVFDKFGPISILKFLQWGLLGLALILTFNRSYWVAATLALVLLTYLGKECDRRRLILLSVISLLLIVIMLVPALGDSESRPANFIRATFTRLATLGNDETFRESSLQWRYVENENALRQIASHPLLGLGLGARYRPFDRRIDYPGREWDARGYIHNGHFWIIVKTGLLGYLGLVWLSLTFLGRGFAYWRLIPNSQMRGIVLGFSIAYLGVLMAAVTSPMLMEWPWTPVIGLMMGVNEAVLRTTLVSRQQPVRNS